MPGMVHMYLFADLKPLGLAEGSRANSPDRRALACAHYEEEGNDPN